MKLLVSMFVDGSEVDFSELVALGLIERGWRGYRLTDKAKQYL